MFQAFQKKLLLKHPVLWNLRVVPAVTLLVFLNVLSFGLGYLTEYIDFKEQEDSYHYENNVPFIFLTVAVSLLLLIFGLVQYFKNNAFKAFYPVKSGQLYKEWILLFGLLFGMCLLIPAFFYGKEVKIRSYYSAPELRKRAVVLSEASFFIEGSYSFNNSVVAYEVDVVTKASVAVDSAVTVQTKDSLANCQCFYLRGKKYSTGSLLNKNIDSYSFFDQPTDSLRRLKIQNWLIDQKKDSIIKIMKAYLSIAKEHHLKGNVTPEEWYALLVENPQFETLNSVGSKQDNGVYIPNNYNTNTRFDSINKYIINVDKETREYYKHYVPHDHLDYNYSRMIDAYVSPDINLGTLLIPLYVALGLSLLIFSFRVTSGRQWLIALVVVILFNILAGIFTALIHSDYSYAIAVLILLFSAYFYFLRITIKKETKKISGIMLNILLWVSPAFWILIDYLVQEILDDLIFIYHIYTNSHPLKIFIEENLIPINYFNIVFVIVLMIYYTNAIRKWRGIAEE